MRAGYTLRDSVSGYTFAIGAAIPVLRRTPIVVFAPKKKGPECVIAIRARGAAVLRGLVGTNSAVHPTNRDEPRPEGPESAEPSLLPAPAQVLETGPF
jgi:hypothetical protein